MNPDNPKLAYCLIFPQTFATNNGTNRARLCAVARVFSRARYQLQFLIGSLGNLSLR